MQYLPAVVIAQMDAAVNAIHVTSNRIHSTLVQQNKEEATLEAGNPELETTAQEEVPAAASNVPPTTSTEDGDAAQESQTTAETTSHGAATEETSVPAPPPPPKSPTNNTNDSMTFVESWLRIPNTPTVTGTPQVKEKEIEEDIVAELVRRHALWINSAG
ncbi:hypothetical protein R3P38DRAFT_3429107 [Favolaschia claudopus]|uniref:Uncharacterized protein n=1 Tax=Favolaschia claudopus TaxID=2862362 RepID=A0AAV9ZWE2_9AGAR